MRYQLADIVNGPFGMIFNTREQAEQAFIDSVKEGKELNLEFSSGQTDKGSDGQTVEEFLKIIEIN